MQRKNLKRAAALAVMTVTMLLAVSATSAVAAINFTAPAQNQVIPETNDFASRQFAEPWGMSSIQEMSYGQYHQQISGFRIKNGILRGRTTGNDAFFHPLFPGYRDAVPIGRDGAVNRIDTSKFDTLSVRMYSSRRTTAQVFWFFNNVWTDYGLAGFRVYPGWRTYKIYLGSHPKWRGRPMGLRFDPAYQSGVDFRIDWMRLHEKSGRRVKFNWTETNPDSKVAIYLDRDKVRGNNPLDKLITIRGRAANSYIWDPAGYDPGSYYLYLKKPGEPGVYSKRIAINRGPLIKITNPSEKGGKDYATTELGKPWSMRDPGGVAYFTDIKDVNFSNGILSGTTVSHDGNYNDGYFHLRVGKPIDTNKYHRLTYRFRYDGPFNFGYGTMTRALWSPDRWDIAKYSTSDDMVTYPRWREYTVDLKKMPLDAGYYGWKGRIREFRFDPLEVPTSWRFHLDYIRLRADVRANTGMTIRWTEGRKTSRPTKVALYYDTDQKNFNGKLIAKDLTSVSGKNSYKWKTSNIPAGKYWIYMVAKDGLNVSKAYSSGPVVVWH